MGRKGGATEKIPCRHALTPSSSVGGGGWLRGRERVFWKYGRNWCEGGKVLQGAAGHCSLECREREIRMASRASDMPATCRIAATENVGRARVSGGR